MAIPPVPPGGGRSSWSQDQPPPTIGNSPPNQSNRRRWILLCGVLGVVVALAAGLLVWKFDPGRGGSQSADGDIDRTVGVLREKDPVCDEWGKYADELAVQTRKWAEMDASIPASSWSAEQREVVQAAAVSISVAADHFQSILPMAKDRAVQELIAQVIVYWRAYVDTIPTYVKEDEELSGVASNFGSAITYICTAFPVVPHSTRSDSRRRSSVADADKLSPFMMTMDTACSEFMELVTRQNALLRPWADADSALPASEWSYQQRRLHSAVLEVLARDISQAYNIAESATNPIFADLVFLYSAYLQAFADAIPTYTPDDDQIWKVAIYLAGGLGSACEAQS